MCAYSNRRNEFLVIINGYVEFNPTLRGLNVGCQPWFNHTQIGILLASLHSSKLRQSILAIFLAGFKLSVSS